MTLEEIIKSMILLIVLFIVLYYIVCMIFDSQKEFRYKNISIKKVSKDTKKRIEKMNKRNKLFKRGYLNERK